MKEDQNNTPDSEDSEDEITQLTPEESLDQKIQNPLVEMETRLKEANQSYLLARADLENYRKRVAKEKEEIVQHASEKLLKELVEVKDHLELALSHAKKTEESTDLKNLHEGVRLTLKQMDKFLEKFGVREVEALGKPFNPSFHEAIQEEVRSDYMPGTVCQVYQKGYLFNERLLRASRVVVARKVSE